MLHTAVCKSLPETILYVGTLMNGIDACKNFVCTVHCRDVKKLGNDPKWDTMNKTGTDGQWWLDCEWHCKTSQQSMQLCMLANEEFIRVLPACLLLLLRCAKRLLSSPASSPLPAAAAVMNEYS
jgi:hypothetical protein